MIHHAASVTRRRHIPVLLAATLFLLAMLPVPAGARTSSAAKPLADLYSPVMMLRDEREPPCETKGEQYRPTSVGITLGNPAVTLMEALPQGGERLIERAPTAADITDLGPEFNLNLPGNPLGDTCVYAKAFREIERQGKAPTLVYAHIAREAGHPGFVLQYWFYWYFNQFNDVHESDWEGMQLAFGAATPADVLRTGEEPDEMILFQHDGGERADWDDAKVQKEGTHPVVYSAAGSHATFYYPSIFVEDGSHGSGVGCDDTTPPSHAIRPRVVLVPDQASATGPFRWLTFKGHWGQNEKGFNDGPFGPAAKTRWNEPFAWMQEQRRTSPRLPGGALAGPAVTGAYCGAVATVSKFLNYRAKDPVQATLILVGLAILAVVLVFLTRWSPVDVDELRRRRAFGQLLRTAGRLYRGHWRTLVPIGLSAVPVLWAVNALAWVLAGETAVGGGRRTGFVVTLADAVEQFGRPVAAALLSAVVVVFVGLAAAGRVATLGTSYRGAASRWHRIVLAQLTYTVVTAVLAFSIVGLPVAIWAYVAWQFAPQGILLEDRGIWSAFRASRRLVRHRWFHALRVVTFLWLLGIALGPALGFALIFTNFPLLWINVIGSFVYGLLIPYVALGRTLLFFDLQARAAEPARRGHARRVWWRVPPLRAGKAQGAE